MHLAFTEAIKRAEFIKTISLFALILDIIFLPAQVGAEHLFGYLLSRI